jgi:hypothetical protein
MWAKMLVVRALARAGSETCKTNPMKRVSSVKFQVSSRQGAQAQSSGFKLQTAHFTLLMCKTNPIPGGGRAGRGRRGGCRRPNVRNEPNLGRGMERSYGGMERGVYRVGIPAQRRWAGRVPPVLLSACEAINAVGSGRRACPRSAAPRAGSERSRMGRAAEICGRKRESPLTGG